MWTALGQHATVLFVIARIVGGHGPGHVTHRQGRRIAKASGRDVERFARLDAAGAAWDRPDPGGVVS